MRKHCLLLMSLMIALSMTMILPVYAENANHILIYQVYGTGGKKNVLLVIIL